MNQIIEYLKKLDSRFDRLEQTTAATKAELDEYFVIMKDSFNHVYMKFDQVDERFDQVDERFNKLEVELEDVSEKLEVVSEKLEVVSEKLEDTSEKLEDVTERLTGVELVVENIRSDIRAFGEGHSGNAQRIDRLEDRVDKLESKAS